MLIVVGWDIMRSEKPSRGLRRAIKRIQDTPTIDNLEGLIEAVGLGEKIAAMGISTSDAVESIRYALEHAPETKEPIHLKLISPGCIEGSTYSGMGIRLIDTVSGRELFGVRDVRVEAPLDDVVLVHLELIGVEL